MVEVILHLVIFWQAQQITVLHVHEILWLKYIIKVVQDISLNQYTFLRVVLDTVERGKHHTDKM